jgi:hypothetical protein
LLLQAICVGAIAAASFAGCGAKRLAYSPAPGFSVDEARSIVLRTIEEQHRRYRPASVSVTEEKIEIVKHRVKTKRFLLVPTSVAVPETKTIYFDKLGTSDLFLKDGFYLVRVRSSDGRRQLRVFCRDLATAERFADAIAVLADAFAR